jgi:hypothetical protein
MSRRTDQCQDKPSPGVSHTWSHAATQPISSLLSTLWASDRAVHRSDRAGFRMFPRVPSVCKGWNAVRVPPRAQHDPSSEGFCFNVWTLTPAGPSDGVRGMCLAPRSPIRLCGWRVRVLAGGPSACWNLGLWVVPSCCSGGRWLALTHSWPRVVVTT